MGFEKHQLIANCTTSSPTPHSGSRRPVKNGGVGGGKYILPKLQEEEKKGKKGDTIKLRICSMIVFHRVRSRPESIDSQNLAPAR